MQDVYPRLKKFCQEHGYEFQVVDMRWGIRDESMDEHETLELCIREIENCQKFSTGPSFVVSFEIHMGSPIDKNEKVLI